MDEWLDPALSLICALLAITLGLVLGVRLDHFALGFVIASAGGWMFGKFLVQVRRNLGTDAR